MTNSSFHPSLTLDIAYKRSEILNKIRQFFADREVLEVQTPIMSQAGNTDVFVPSVSANVTVHDQAKTYYLHTSPEFAMKRMLASWQVPIYQICPVFRDNEIGSRHNIEFTMLEWYRPHFSLDQLGVELGDLLSLLYGYPVIINHMSYAQAFMDYVGIHPLTASCEVLSAIASDKGLGTIDLGDDHQGWLDMLFSHLVEPQLGHELPTLINDYPPATAALAKIESDREGNQVARRFELYINGLEIANAYDELADAQALRVRFAQDNATRKKRGLPVMPIDERLLAACDELPPCSGIALGVDRLVMVLTGAGTINEVIGFGVGRA
ncbi:MAG: EF-P lysine aminoacylase EpmA [Psychrobacter sp.]|nr:EF-P lysine aminoacylase EpmA [Psychrobacter sp.]